MFCPNCGAEMQSGIRFCTKCGTKLDVDQPKMATETPRKIESTPGKMAKIQCELCGSTDIMKDDGFFVCQHCGCKYSLEEARKMMIEGKVDVSGSTIKVDTNQEVVGLIQLAYDDLKKRALDNCDKHLEEAISKDNGISDSWFMKAVLYRYDSEFYDTYSERAKKCERNIGIFTEEMWKQQGGIPIPVLFSDSFHKKSPWIMTIDYESDIAMIPNDKVTTIHITPGEHKFVLWMDEWGENKMYAKIYVTKNTCIGRKLSLLGTRLID